MKKEQEESGATTTGEAVVRKKVVKKVDTGLDDLLSAGLKPKPKKK